MTPKTYTSGVSRLRARLVLSVALLVLASHLGFIGRVVANHERSAAAATDANSQQSNLVGENGISVGQPKIFDNRTLTLMLETMSETLRNLQVIDQDPLKKALGLLQGAQITDVARSLSVLSGGLPKTVTTEDSTTQTDSQLKPSAEDASIEALIDKKVSEKLGLKTETTTSERTASLPQLPELIAAPTGLPAFGQSPFDLLTDQVNLTYQILNIRMLLERSLSDRLHKEGGTRLQTVLGFNVSIDPPRGSENSAAVVEVNVRTEGGEPVSLVALMPQEKTYNAVAIHTKSNAFGGSAVSGMTTVGYSERRRGQIFYLYRDNDTLSFERMATSDRDLTFGWQFRPVLGRKSVSPGMRQMFAVVSLPLSDDSDASKYESLKVSVKTYWKKYYPGTLTTADRGKVGAWPYITKLFSLGLAQVLPTKGVVERPSGSPVRVPTTARYQNDLRPEVHDVRWTRVDDRNALVSIRGDNFFSGTTVVMGGPSPAVGVVIKSTQAMDVMTPIENIGAGTAMVIGRYGVAEPVVAKADACTPTTPSGTTLSLPFAAQRELRVVLDCPPDKLAVPEAQLVIFANGKPVPGLAQVSLGEKGQSIVTASIPLELFPKGEGSIAIVRPFRAPFRIEFPWYDNPYEVKRSHGATGTVLFVTRRDGVELNNVSAFGVDPLARWKIEYAGSDIKPTFPSPAVMRFEIPIPEAEGTFVLFEPGGGLRHNVVLLDMPSARPKPKLPIEAATPGALSINQGDAPKLEFTGESIDAVTSVRVEGRDSFRAEYDSGKRILSVYVTQDATKVPGKLTIQFRDKAGKLLGTALLEVKALPGKTGEQQKG